MLYSIGGADALAVTVARALGVKVAEHEERDFEDGEHKIRPLTSVRARDVYVLANLVSSPGQSVNDKLCKTLFFIEALKRSAARQVTLCRAVSLLWAQGKADENSRSRRYQRSGPNPGGCRRRLRHDRHRT